MEPSQRGSADEATIAPDHGQLDKLRGTALGAAGVDLKAAQVNFFQVPSGIDEGSTRGVFASAL